MTLASINADMLPKNVGELATRIAAAGGRAFVVGGWVRDRLLGADPADLDIEVHGLSAHELDDLLAGFGPVHSIGRSFAIRRVRGISADVSWVEPPVGLAPLRNDDSLDPHYARAARRRDMTVNSMGFDPLSGRLFDPAGGRADLEARRLRFVDEARFGDDPVRVLRVAGLAARLEMTPDEALIAICTRQDLAPIPGERLMNEWTNLLTLARRPSVALDWLERMGQLDAFPEIDALRGVPQDARWHPEGDVFIHTQMTLDAAASLRGASEAPLALMFAALCHDFGKPSTTTQIETSGGEDGQGGDNENAPEERIRAIRHERAGIAPTRSFMQRLQASNRLLGQVEVLVDRHLAPVQFASQGAGDKAYRRLVRKLDRAHVKPRLLADVARADHLGRTTEDARLGRFEEGDVFLERIAMLGLRDGPEPAVVRGRHLVARGHSPGPEYGEILERCLALQDATGLDDPDELLSRVTRGQKQKSAGED